MLIFAIMVASMGVLYSRITPTLFGYEAEVKSTNQEFVFLSIGNTMQQLIASAEGSQGRVHIISNQAIYSVDTGQEVQIQVNDSVTGLLNSTSREYIGVFNADVDGVFSAQANPVFLNEGVNEDSLLSGDNTNYQSSFLSKVKYSSSSASFSLYIKPRIDLTTISAGNYLLTITMVKVTYDKFADGTAIDFPVELDEWTLRLRRGAANITSDSIPALTGDIVVGDNFGGSVSFSATPGDSLTIKFIEIPIKFGI
jgi:hypothetical protein